MKIRVDVREFKETLDKVKTVCPKKTLVSALQRIYIKAENNEIICYATDLDQFLEIKVNGVVAEDGECGIDVDDLKVISKANGDMLLETFEEKLKIQFGKKTVSVTDFVLDEEDRFKVPQNETETEIIEVGSDWLYESLIKLATFVSIKGGNKTTYTININTKARRMESLDLERVGARRIPENIIKEIDDNCMLHVMCIKPIKKIIGKKSKDKIMILKGNKYIKIVGVDFTYYQRIVEGRYYDTNSLWRINENWRIKVNKAELKEVMRYNSELQMNKINPEPTIFYIIDGQAKTYFDNVKYESKDELEIKQGIGTGYVGVNSSFVADALNCVETEEVEILGATSKTIMLITADDYSFVLLPINIKEEKMEYIKEKLAV